MGQSKWTVGLGRERSTAGRTPAPQSPIPRCGGGQQGETGDFQGSVVVVEHRPGDQREANKGEHDRRRSPMTAQANRDSERGQTGEDDNHPGPGCPIDRHRDAEHGENPEQSEGPVTSQQRRRQADHGEPSAPIGPVHAARPEARTGVWLSPTASAIHSPESATSTAVAHIAGTTPPPQSATAPSSRAPIA